MTTDGRRRESLLLSLLVLGAALACVLVLLARVDRSVAEVLARERAAHSAAQRVVQAQTRLLAARGAYGGVADLAAAGLLDLPLTTVAGATCATLDGYRLDVLLPTGPGIGPLVPVGLPELARPDAELARKHFAVVARPLEPGRSGYRIWYLDEAGRTFVCEGVSDEEGLAANPLPEFLVTRPSDGREPGPVWRSVDDELRSR